MPQRTATGPNGEKLVLQDGKWVPMDVPTGFVGPLDERTGPLPGLGRDPEEQTRNLRQGLRQGFGTFLANVLSVPHASGELLAAAAALPALVPGGRSFSEARAKQEGSLPASALLAIPEPSTEDVLAATNMFGKFYADPRTQGRRPVSTRFDEALAEEGEKADANPLATGAGRTAGDVASMMLLRPGKRAADLLPGRFNPHADLTTTKGRLDAAARALARGTGRTVEAGFDGAVMGALGDGDPAKTAAWSAGIQAGGSAALAAKNAFFRKPLSTFATLFLGHEMWKAVAPGPQDFFSSKDQAVNEMIAAYGLGLAARLAGAGRDPNRIIGAMEHASRAGIASVVTQLQEAAAANQPQYARVLELLAQDQERFGTDARVLLERAARSEEPRALLNQIDELMKSARFRKAIENAETASTSEPEAQQDSAQPSFADWLMRGGR